MRAAAAAMGGGGGEGAAAGRDSLFRMAENATADDGPPESRRTITMVRERHL